MHQTNISHAASPICAVSKRTPITQKHYNRTLFEASADAIMITDINGIISEINEHMATLTGCAKSKLVGTNWFDHLPDPVRASVAFAQALTEGRISNVELVICNASGDQVPVTYSAAPIYNRRKLVGVFSTLRDASELNRLKRELIEKSDELERANEMKSAFLATMSHELRTPLTAILGFSEALLCGILGNIGEEQKEYIQDIHDSGQHLLELISDILDMAQIEAGMMQLHLETADISNVLMHSLGQASGHSCIELEIDEGSAPYVAQLDLRITQKIVDHMLSNGVKFSAPNGRVRINVCRVQRRAVGKIAGSMPQFGFPLPVGDHTEFIQLTVHDSGIGITPQNLPKVFQMFNQIDRGLERRFEGVGLGATMVQRLAELHSGTTAIASVEGKGTIFAVWLPIRNEPINILHKRLLPH